MADSASRVESFLENGLVVGRLLPGTDLVPGLHAACRSHGVAHAVVVSLIGSLRETAFVYVNPAADSPTGVRYGDPIAVPGGVEIVSCQGMIGRWHDDRPTVHLHVVMIDTAGTIHAGHLLDEGNPTLVTVEFALRVLNHSIVRRVDSELGFPIFHYDDA